MPKSTKEIAKPQVEIILPLPDPETRGAFIQQRGEQIRSGELTILDVGKELNLSLQMIQWARLYTSEDFFGVGNECAAKAYGYDLNTKRGLANARNMASTLRKHRGVQTLCNCLMDAQGLNRTHMNMQLYDLCTQNEDSPQPLGL